MIIGTNHFTSILSAERYYLPYYGPGLVKDGVKCKISHGEIVIGKPEVKPGEEIILNQKEQRYMIRVAGYKS